jgi:copper(I)-binding protein
VCLTPPSRPRGMRSRALLSSFALSLAAVALAGCTDDGATSDATATSPSHEAAALTITDVWVKAADTGMTGAFGILHNDSETPVTVVSASSDVANLVELHETVADATGEMVMRPVTGFEVPAGGELELAPGGDHIMLMGLVDPIEPGEEITIVLTTNDGSTLTATAAARTFVGANETYHGEATMPAPTTEAP